MKELFTVTKLQASQLFMLILTPVFLFLMGLSGVESLLYWMSVLTLLAYKVRLYYLLREDMQAIRMLILSTILMIIGLIIAGDGITFAEGLAIEGTSAWKLMMGISIEFAALIILTNINHFHKHTRKRSRA